MTTVEGDDDWRFNFIWRHADWQVRAAHLAETRNAYRAERRYHEEIWRPPEIDRVGLDCPDFTLLMEELGGPFYLEPDGQFGSFPYAKELHHSTAWESCSAIPLGSIRTIEPLMKMEQEQLLMIWPWIAHLSCEYADQQGRDRGEDLSPSEIDEQLDTIERAALKLNLAVDRLREAGNADRSFGFASYRKRVALLEVFGSLNDAVGGKPRGLENLQSHLSQLRSCVRSVRGNLSDIDIRVVKSGDPGVQTLTTACAYLWSDLTQRRPTAARATKTHKGEESDFVLFVQSVARLQSNVVPTIKQIATALKADDWHGNFNYHLGIRWNSTDRAENR